MLPEDQWKLRPGAKAMCRLRPSLHVLMVTYSEANCMIRLPRRLRLPKLQACARNSHVLMFFVAQIPCTKYGSCVCASIVPAVYSDLATLLNCPSLEMERKQSSSCRSRCHYASGLHAFGRDL